VTRIVKSRAHSAATSAALIALIALPLTAQRPALRISGSTNTVIEGTRIDSVAAFPARALESLGFRLSTDRAHIIASIGGDTVRLSNTSPFVRAGSRVHQLASAVHTVDTTLHVPEQFFIQWLPRTYPQRFEFRDGAVIVKGAVAPPAPQPQARPQRPPTQAARVVVIDPGHGGRDPGKIGPNGLREKDVALTISQRLANVLRQRGYEVHLTRTKDTLIALADRPKLANQWRGDRPVAVFLSIHANSAPQSSARGFETFFLSDARTDDERRVAEMENEAVRFEDRPSGPVGTDLDQVLNSLLSDFLLRMSNDLASVTQQKLAGFHPGPNRGVKRAGFVVLIGSIMPAVLIETAFISNSDEASLLATQSFQEKIAFGIADSVDEFFRRNEHLWVHGP
jgi:N-acetylmuramoyl-L-alanine amidase